MMMAQLQQDKDRLDLAPKKFNMWLFVFASFMMFAALTSGFIVYAGGNASHSGTKIILPQAFLYSSIVIVFSSLTMFLASRAARQSQFEKQKLFLSITALLGIAFLGLQVYGLNLLVKTGVLFVNDNASQSFIYVFVGLHLLHIVAGLALLFYTLSGSYKNMGQAKNVFRMEFASIFWHFVDIIWIYLYVFLLLNQY
jgi:cytochrome c oxidase subunit 3